MNEDWDIEEKPINISNIHVTVLKDEEAAESWNLFTRAKQSQGNKPKIL